MALFDGLYIYEVVLLICGIALFLALLAAFLRKVFTNQGYVGLLAFFVMPIAMIGFPAITSFQVKTSVGDIELQTNALQSHPQDQTARAALQTEVSKIEARPIKDPTLLATIARAQFALGDESKAESNLKIVLASSPTLAPAVELKNKIELTNNLKAQTTAAESHPEDTKAREELQSTYTKLSQLPLANPKAIATMSKAQTVLQQKAPNSH